MDNMDVHRAVTGTVHNWQLLSNSYTKSLAGV